MFILTFVIFGQVDGTKCHCVQLDVTVFDVTVFNNVFAGLLRLPRTQNKLLRCNSSQKPVQDGPFRGCSRIGGGQRSPPL